ncbi:MAG: hypothetical protein DRG83_01335 [Deltaproteobacteria bacterium]|nr:MAG: hypothetical protein DRG83_01335 [Deltaproteobacteria bacterium]
MIIVCPHCRKKSRVDESKLPVQPVPVACPHCSLTIYISRRGVQAEQIVPPELPELEATKTYTESMSWLERSSVFDIVAYYRTAKEFLLRPEAAFSKWEPDLRFNDALIFLIVFGSLGKILNEYWFYLLTGLMGSIEKSPYESVFTFLVSALFTPIGIVLGTFVYSAVTHFMLYIFRGVNRSWHSTFATIAWVSGSVSLLSVFPLIGALAASVWGFISTMIGLKVVHKTSSVKAFFALTLPGLIILVILLMIIFAILGTTLLLGLSQMMEILKQQGRFPI